MSSITHPGACIILYALQVASNQKVESVFLEWNIENTEQLLRKLDDAQEKRKAAHDKIFETIDNTYVKFKCLGYKG